MGSCTRRHFLLSTCFLQLVTIIERQVFDFLGYMWTPILANFFHIIFVIFGFYGAYHFRAKYIITYLIWSFIWIGWNTFLICFYLDIGILNKNSDILNLGTGSVSWFEVNGYGCKPIYPINITSEDPYRPVRPEQVDDCLIDYPIVEVIHSGIQCILSLLAILGAILIAQIFLDEDDRSTKSSNKKSKQRQSFYSVEFGPPVDTIRGCPENLLDYQDTDGHGGISQLSPKPMTPRRVKRRSVMTRGSNSRQSTQSRRSHSSSRNSVRNSRRKFQQNPVTKLLDQQQQLQLQIQQPQQQQQSKTIKTFASFSHIENPTLTATNLKTLNHDIISNTSIINNNINTKSNYNQFQENLNTDPIYYNTSNSTTQLQQTWVSNNSPIQGNVNPVIIGAGHLNPSYQHSTPNLTNSTEHIDELYNNRPPSVRSSYSNFHGTRPLSSYNTTENVFAGITTQQLNQRHIQQQLQPTSILNPSSSISQPQVPPTRRSASRESVRSMAFLNNGPPAYNLNYHTPPDSETTM